MDESQTTPKPHRRSWFPVLAALALTAVIGWQWLWPIRSAVAWGHDFDAALAQARTESRPVLISFSSRSCPYCREMETSVFPQQNVLDEVAKFVPIKVDAFAAEALAARYDVQGLPAFVVTDASGRMLTGIAGFQPAEKFIRFLQRAEALAGERPSPG